MNDSLTVAEKVRRQLKAGRKRKTRSLPSLLNAVQRLCAEADRARSLMQKYGLDPDDIRLALLCRVAGVPGMPPIQTHPLPPPGNIGAFIKPLEDLAALTRVDFIGILWALVDRDPKAKAPFIPWYTEFVEDKHTSHELDAFMNERVSKPARAN